MTPENRVDLKILRLNISAQIFGEQDLKEWAWNPLVYLETLSNSVYLLTARDFAPADQRLQNIESRLAQFPRVIAQAKENLRGSPKIHTQTAIRQLAGTIGLVREGLKSRDEVALESRQREAANPAVSPCWKNSRRGWKTIPCRDRTAISESATSSFGGSSGLISTRRSRRSRCWRGPRRI